MHVLLAVPTNVNAAPWLKALSTALPDTRISVWKPADPSHDAEVAVVWHPTPELFERERKLRMVFNLGAGVDSVLAVPTLPATVPIVRLEDAGMALQMTEYVLHALWRVARNFGAYQQAQCEEEWAVLPATRRSDWPVGVLGLGAIGSRVAQAAAQFGYPVAGWARSKRELAGVDVFAGAEQLPALLSRTRVLVNTLPLTPETRDILNRDTLAQLLPQAHVINVGRGQHLVEKDLLDAIERGHVAGATLDVFRTEPLPAGHPFWRHPAITVTPHASARTLRDESIAQIASKIRQLQRGESISGVVDRSRGY